MSTDRIERTIVLSAPRSRVWRALINTDEFGAWFGVALEGAFAPGAHLTGRRTAPGCEHETMEFVVERVETEHLLAYRWHFDASEPTTLVEFSLADVAEGTRLTIVESGFDHIPLSRRAAVCHLHDQGWADLLTGLAQYVAG